jgi:hypothetical protein
MQYAKEHIDILWTQSLSIGDVIDIKDKSQKGYVGRWMRGKIIDICYLYIKNKVLEPSEFKIHYIGWHDKWDETLYISNKQHKKRIAPAYSKYPKWRENLQKNHFIDVNVREFGDGYSNTNMACDNCINNTHSYSCLAKNNIVDFKNIWQVGMILYRYDNYLLIQILPGHLCFNKIYFKNRNNLFVCKNIYSEELMPVNTHSKNYCKDILCNGCSTISTISTHKLQPNLKKIIMDYFNFYKWDINKHIPEKHCYICFENYNVNDTKPLYLSCGHNLCFNCFQEKMKRKLLDNINSSNNWEIAIVCDYCKKKIFHTNINRECKVSVIDKKEIEFLKQSNNSFAENILQINYTNNKYYELSAFGYHLQQSKPNQYLVIIDTDIHIDIAHVSEYINNILPSNKNKYIQISQVDTY